MTELRVGDQLIHYDRDATISMYSQVLQGDSDLCGCPAFRNFAQLRSTAYPEGFAVLLDALGIDSTKENEAVYNGLKGDLHSYDVRFFFVGQLIETGEQSVKLENEFHYWIGTAAPGGSSEFGKNMAVVECTTVIPWALRADDDPELSVQMAKAEEIMHRYRNALRALANTDR